MNDETIKLLLTIAVSLIICIFIFRLIFERNER